MLFFSLSQSRVWLRSANRQIAVGEMQRSQGHWSKERTPCLKKHIAAWKSEEMLEGILIHRVYFVRSAWLSRSIHKDLGNVRELGKMAARGCALVAGQNGPGILVWLGPWMCWKMQNIPRDQRRFLKEKGIHIGKQTAKISTCHFALKYFTEESDFCEFNF